ncbi:hypothetical protein ACFQZS_16545 [Mucilaginibacter calamicampi]|uniref:DoxX-like family protein n=1 Tax=Mucilaginibacter calamicampi TaxID=1302352 RepID=A0ABW2YZ53_9SPHI
MSIRQRVAAQKYIYAGSVLLGLAFIGTGLQHFIYLQFVATLVPAYMPVKILWAGLTGAAMILAGVSFLIRRRTTLAAMLLSLMMLGFILLIHIPKLISAPHEINNWIRAMQDLAILGTALMLTSTKTFNKAGIALYALPLILLGVAHFMHPALITPKVPAYLPAASIIDYFVGAAMTGLGVCIVARRYALVCALAMGALLLVFALLYSVPTLAANIKDGGEWTTLLLALAVAGGGFVAAGKVGK